MRSQSRFIISVNRSKPGYASLTCSKIEHIPYSLIFTTFNDSSILITIISCDFQFVVGE